MRLLFLLFTASLVIGFSLIQRSHESFQSRQQAQLARDPAAIRAPFDFSGVQGKNALEAIKKRLVTGTRLLRRGELVGIEIGNFVIRGQSGQRIFACEEYQTLRLVFEGDGTIIGGEKPMMTLLSPCEISRTDINRLAAIWLNSQTILASPLGTPSIALNEAGDQVLKFTNVSEEWPRVWALLSIELLNEANRIFVEPEDLAALRKEPLIMEFQ